MRINKQKFLANLLQTQIYCDLQLQSNTEQSITALRSLNSTFGEEKLFRYTANQYSTSAGRVPALLAEWHLEAKPFDNEFIAIIFASQLAAKDRLLISDSGESAAGEILVVEYDLNIPDGVAAIESEGFVDGFDFPPIDTWFYHTQNGGRGWVLFAWVPEHFIELAQEAIDVHFLDIIHWFKDWAPLEYLRLTS